MKRRIFILLTLVNVFLLSSCSSGGHRFIIFDDSEKKVDARMEDILDALKNGDKDALKEMFSKKALSDADDIEGQLDYLFNFFQGSVESWERTGFSSDESIDHGEKSTMLRSFFSVKTDKDEYKFFLIDYPIDTINPDNEGMYTLRVVEKFTQFTYWTDMEIAGIYKPEDIESQPTPSTQP
jgi:hypothetical protein